MKSPARKSAARPAKLCFESPTKKARANPKAATTPSDTVVVARRVVTPADEPAEQHATEPKEKNKNPRKKLPFHVASAPQIDITDNVRLTYKLVRKHTGSVGGNGSFGAIYGELTMGSMQKMVNLMKEHTDFSATSKFIDVGSGIGKPNLHVMQDPGVAFSYGIEMERSRWLLGMASLKAVLAEARNKPTNKLKFSGMFDHGNIKQAKTFDPFTHVYMFSIGFPPSLWEHLSDMFNKSASPYLICFHSPKIIIERYEFDVELLVQTPTSMHGSSEGHMGYLYKRTSSTSTKKKKTPVECSCDDLYQSAHSLVVQTNNLENLYKTVAASVDAEINGGRVTRAKKVVHCIESDHSTSTTDEE